MVVCPGLWRANSKLLYIRDLVSTIWVSTGVLEADCSYVLGSHQLCEDFCLHVGWRLASVLFRGHLSSGTGWSFWRLICMAGGGGAQDKRHSFVNLYFVLFSSLLEVLIGYLTPTGMCVCAHMHMYIHAYTYPQCIPKCIRVYVHTCMHVWLFSVV